MNMIDLFSGAGGLTLGLERAGFRSLLAVDSFRDSADTYRNAFPDVQHKCCPIEDLSFRDFRGIELVAGGPPCQPFSSGGKRLASNDVRDTIPEFLRAIEEVQPRAFIMENVPGLVSTDRRPYFDGIIGKMNSLGYFTTWAVLNAANYGVPQNRRRLFVVGLVDRPFRFPEATHGPTAETPYIAAGDFLSKSIVLGQPNPSAVIYALNPDLRPSPYDGHLFNGGGRPINFSKPCHTILASAGGNKTHFVDTLDEVPAYHAHLLEGGSPRKGILAGGRRLTVLESALLQTFPRGMTFAGSRSSQYTQIGNAVPPLLAAAVGSALVGQFVGSSEPVRMQRIDKTIHQFNAGLLPVQ